MAYVQPTQCSFDEIASPVMLLDCMAEAERAVQDDRQTARISHWPGVASTLRHLQMVIVNKTAFQKKSVNTDLLLTAHRLSQSAVVLKVLQSLGNEEASRAGQRGLQIIAQPTHPACSWLLVLLRYERRSALHLSPLWHHRGPGRIVEHPEH